MIELKTKIRKDLGKKVKKLRKAGIVPAVLYGPKIKEPFSLEVDAKKFEAILKEAGESALISLEIDGKKPARHASQGDAGGEKLMVLIHDFEKEPVSGETIHIDFYQPNLEEEIEVKIPLIFEGEALAVKDLGGTLVKSLSEIAVKAKPQNLPKEIRADIEKLKTFTDYLLIEDLPIQEGVKILRDSKEIVAFVSVPEKMEEAKPKVAEAAPSAAAAPESAVVSEAKKQDEKS